MKCRNCEAIIPVPVGGEEDPEDLSALSAAAMSHESMGASVSSVAGAKAPADQSDSEDDDQEDGGEQSASVPSLPSGFGAALKAARGRIGTRQFRVLSYPGAQALDQVLPWLIGALCLIPVLWQGVHAATANDPKWIGLTQYGLIFVLFLLLVIPVTVRGLRMAADMLHFELPESAGWRTLGLFSLPLALGAIFYWQLDEFSGLIFGLALGLLLVAPLILIVMQLHWVEAVVTWMMGALFFSASAAITAGVAFVVGLIIVASTSTPAGKPPVKIAVKTPPKSPVVVATTEPVPAPTPPVDPTVIAPPTTQEAVTPTTVPTVAAATQPGGDEIAFVPVNPTPAPPPPPPVVPTPPKPDAAKIDPSPLVSAAKDMTWLTDFDEVLQSDAGKTPLAVVKHSPETERVQIVDPSHDKIAGEVSFKRDPAGSDHYLVTPAGDALLRVLTWPKLTVQALALTPGKMLPNVDLDESLTNTTLLGVSAGDMLFVKGESSGARGLLSLNLRTGQRGRAIGVSAFFVDNGVAVSPDGKTVAVAAKIDDVSQLQILNSAGTTRRFVIKALDAKWPLEPVGLSFSPDSSRVAICFEHEGGILAVAWNVATGKQLYERIYLPGMMPVPSRNEFKGRAFDWLGDNSTWLLFGQTVIDAPSGQALGVLGVDRVIGQRVADAKSVDLVCKVGLGEKRIVHLDLDADNLAKMHIAATQPAK